MFKEPVVYVDIETTGVSYRSNRIIEVAAIRVENDQIVDTFTTLVNPGSPIPYYITRLTGITSGDVADAPQFEAIAERLHEILSGAIFIAHNVRFDYSFIKKQLALCNITYNPRMLCSVRMSRALYPQEKGHSLQAIINRFELATTARHRAYEDAEVIWRFFKHAHQQHGPDLFTAAALKQLKHKSAPPNVAGDAFDNIPNTPGVYTFYDKDKSPIYIGKSVTLRKRVMSHFAQDTAIDKEMKLSLHTHTISFIETGTELEALLLESRMVKEQLPLYNRMLRRYKKMYVLYADTNDDEYMTISVDLVDSEDIQPDNSIYGVYPSKMKAKHALEEIQKTFELCPKLLGLEKSNGACFKYQLHKCRGACIGDEPHHIYNQRLETAFERNKLESWPYKDPIVLSQLTADNQQKNLVIDNWNVIGEIYSDEGCETQYKAWQSVFDLDTYKIIRGYLARKSSSLTLQPISHAQLNAMQGI